MKATFNGQTVEVTVGKTRKEDKLTLVDVTASGNGKEYTRAFRLEDCSGEAAVISARELVRYLFLEGGETQPVDGDFDSVVKELSTAK